MKIFPTIFKNFYIHLQIKCRNPICKKIFYYEDLIEHELNCCKVLKQNKFDYKEKNISEESFSYDKISINNTIYNNHMNEIGNNKFDINNNTLYSIHNDNNNNYDSNNDIDIDIDSNSNRNNKYTENLINKTNLEKIYQLEKSLLIDSLKAENNYKDISFSFIANTELSFIQYSNTEEINLILENKEEISKKEISDNKLIINEQRKEKEISKLSNKIINLEANIVSLTDELESIKKEIFKNEIQNNNSNHSINYNKNSINAKPKNDNIIRILNISENTQINQRKDVITTKNKLPENFCPKSNLNRGLKITKKCELCFIVENNDSKKQCCICLRSICKSCLVACERCKRNICNICSKCDICKLSEFCKECRNSCNKCQINNNSFCNKCVKKCEKCTKSFCKICCGFTCKDTKCKANICLTCCWNCRICFNNYCEDIKNTICSNCGVKACEEKCNDVCLICNKTVCLHCIVNCNFCQKKICKVCSIKNVRNKTIHYSCIKCI